MKNNSLKILVLIACLIRPSLEIVPTAIDALISGIQIVSDTAKTMYDNLSDNDKITPVDVVLAYLETIPIIGTIVHILNKDSINYQKLILSKLESLSKQQEDTKKLLETLEKKIDFLVTNNQITQSTSYITSCSAEKLNFLRHPDQKPEQDRVITCYDNIMKDIRLLARILTETENTLPKFFQVLIKGDGFCNGAKITNSYKYLFANVVGGCETAIIGEQLKYNGTSTLLLQDCKKLIQDTTDHLNNIFRNCTSESCDITQEILKATIQSSSDRDTNHLLKDLSGKFPWFTFLLLNFKSKPNIQIIGNFIPSVNVFYTKDFYTYIMWTPYATKSGAWDSSVTGFSLQFNLELFIGNATTMNVSKNLQSDPAFITAHVLKENTLTYKACAFSEINLPDKQTSATVNIVAQRFFVLMVILIVLFIR